VTGLQADINSNARRFNCNLKRYKVMIFKRMSKLKTGESLAVRGHGTGVEWLGILLQRTGGLCKQERNVVRGTSLWWL
jgi:hypothetical protein